MRSKLVQRITRVPPGALAAAIVGLAFALRVYRLADKNIWWDEGWTVWLSRQDFAFIALRTAGDDHPPLHYWLLHIWNAVSGSDAVSGRFFSLFFGVLAMALLYRVGKQIGGKWLGLLAALLLAFSRFQASWSQEIRNYTLAAFFSLAAIWFVLRLVSGPAPIRQWGPWIGYIASISLALYSHYLAALIFLSANLFVLVVLLREWLARRSDLALLIRWSLAQIAVLALLAPWMVLYAENAISFTGTPAFDLGLFLRLVATVFSLGVTTYIENYAAIVSVFTLLAVVGALWAVIPGQPRGVTVPLKLGAAFAVIIVLLPPVLIYILSFTPAAFFTPKVVPRYLLMFLPAYLLLVALGLRFLARESIYLGLAALAVVIIAQGYTLGDYYGDRVLKDEYSTMAQAVNSFALPGDALVLNTDQDWPTFMYYIRPDLQQPWIGVPNGSTVDENGAREIAGRAEKYEGAWVVTIPDALAKDPGGLVEAELAKHWPKQYEQTFGDKRLALYSPRVHNVRDVPPENYKPLQSRSDVIDAGLRLTGLDLPVREAQAGDILHVVTYWESRDVRTVQTRLVRPAGAPIAEQDAAISIGAHERAQADFIIPPGQEDARLEVVAQVGLEQVSLGSVSIVPRRVEAGAAAAASEPTRKLNVRLGDSIHLTGIAIPDATFGPGDSIPLTLFWETTAPVPNSYTVFVHLLGSQYNPATANLLWGQIDQLPQQGRLPTTAWLPDQSIADPYSLASSPTAPPGTYQIEVGMYDAATGQRLRVFDADGKDAGDSFVVGEVELAP